MLSLRPVALQATYPGISMASETDRQPAAAPPADQPGHGPVAAAQGSAPRLEGVGLSCVRRDRVLFEGFNLSLGPGELIQIEGANGSGKTSLLRILCLLALPAEGEVRWSGSNVEEVRPEFLEALTYIGHAHGVKADLTPVENLRVASALGAGWAAMDPDEALARIGLAGFEDKPVRELSAGQTRRVALARLLIHPTPLWILDEPFTALDRKGKAYVEALLREHCEAGGMALITTHQPVDLGAATMSRIHLGPEAATEGD
ncbi:heme exporter protein A [Thiohalorhabdus denitrificans]|uniref:Heme exporter protein A n=1 Tax=Thiohalorhabdus denitrificans TaxID=381306 RepID=A0A1G5BP90_9GAMM|nr:heme exporter protein A [Thiohalorhabdus denitrificans]